MGTCVLCNGKKAKRHCPALNEGICTECCGSKRGVKVQFPKECSHYIQGIIRNNEKAIIKLVNESFNDEYVDDLYKRTEVCNVVGPFEWYLFNKYYTDFRVNDDKVFQCLLKMYCTLDGQGELYEFDSYENEWFEMFKEIVEKEGTPLELQKTIVLRMMKSVKMLTGGIFGNKNYFEALRGQFTGEGHMASLFDKKGFLTGD